MIGAKYRFPDAEKGNVRSLSKKLAANFGAAGTEPVPLKTLLSQSDSYFWEWNLKTGEKRRFPSAKRVLGVEKATLEPLCEKYIPRIHRNHRSAVKSTLEQSIANCSGYETEYAVSLPGTPTLWVEEYGRVLADNDGTPSWVVGLSTLTREKAAYEWDLQPERKLNWTLWEALLESQTRADLEKKVVQQLAESSCELVWIGDWLSNRFERRAVVGKQMYLDSLSLGTHIDRAKDPPSVVAAREGEPQFIPDFSSESDSKWGKAAQECGFAAGIALPIIYNDILYGVLSMYVDGTESLGEARRQQLSGLADRLAVVIHNIEAQRTLATNRSIRAKLQLVRPEYYLSDIIRQVEHETSKIRIKVHETLQCNNAQYIQYISVDGAPTERIAEIAAEHPIVEDVTIISKGNGPRIQLILTEETPETVLTSVGTGVRSTSVTAERADILVEVPTKSELTSSITALEESDQDVSILSCIERDSEEIDHTDGPLEDLTDRQATVLQAAYHQGYFQQPREASATEVAASLGISHPTLLEHLRLAQDKVFRTHFAQS